LQFANGKVSLAGPGSTVTSFNGVGGGLCSSGFGILCGVWFGFGGVKSGVGLIMGARLADSQTRRLEATDALNWFS